MSWVARLLRASVDEATARTHAEEWRDVEDLSAGLLCWARPARTEPCPRCWTAWRRRL